MIFDGKTSDLTEIILFSKTETSNSKFNDFIGIRIFTYYFSNIIGSNNIAIIKL